MRVCSQADSRCRKKCAVAETQDTGPVSTKERSEVIDVHTNTAQERPTVALYVRSIIGRSLDGQLQMLQHFARKTGKDQVRVYFDVLDSRTQLERLIADGTSHFRPFQEVLMLEPVRGSFGEQEFSIFECRLKNNGVTIVLL